MSTTEKVQVHEVKHAAKIDPKIEVKVLQDETETAARQEPAAAEAARAAEASNAQGEAVSRVGRAEAIIRRNVLWSLGAGVIPFPIVDVVAVTGVQIKMLSELSDLYGVEFKKEIAKKLLASLLSSLGGVTVGSLAAWSLAKLIPAVGQAFGVVTVPVAAGALTHATGKVFLMHFESGGTLLDFNPHAMRAYFKQEFDKGKEFVSKVQEDHAKSAKPG